MLISLERVGDVRMARGDPAGALQAYTRAVDIFERLARADPDNTEYQRGLLISLRKFGFGAAVAAFSPPGEKIPWPGW
ncbi:MAG TPA: hypothetical protein VEF72_00070 [Mycobacterium sp.]|nr:hypothetical protein [Mycobacterium sp.]